MARFTGCCEVFGALTAEDLEDAARSELFGPVPERPVLREFFRGMTFGWLSNSSSDVPAITGLVFF
jgi:hypothetical protein